MKAGVDYTPEAFEPYEWQRDLSAARALGLSVIRCGASAWSALSPEDGTWEIAWCERFLTIAEANGFEVVWQTPSAVPPPWAYDRWPELAGGRPRLPGRYCPSHADFLTFCSETAGKLQSSLGSSAAIAGWEISTGAADRNCGCPRCAQAFAEWLESQYGTLSALNKAWRTEAWGASLSRFGQLPPPGAEGWPPPFQLASRRYNASRIVSHVRSQAISLRASRASKMAARASGTVVESPYDIWALDELLTASTCLYSLDTADSGLLDMASALGPRPGGRSIWATVGEGTLDTTAWNLYIARCGEAGVEYAFCANLRQLPAGPLASRAALLDHGGRPTGLAGHVADALAAADETEQSLPEYEVYYLHSFEPAWIERPTEAASRWYATAREVCGSVRVGGFQALSGLEETIVAPHLSLREPGVLDKLRETVTQGATLITTLDFGRYDAAGCVALEPPLNLLGSWGVPVPDIEIVPVPPSRKLAGRLNGLDVTGSGFVALPVQAASRGQRYEEIGQIEDGDLSAACVLRTRMGQGQIYIALTNLDNTGLRALMNLACATL